MRLIEQENINLVYRPLPPGYLGWYQRNPYRRPLILISTAIQNGPTFLLRSILWEEVGHHYSLRPAIITGRWTTYTERTHRSIQEYRALRWAAERILTLDDWLSVADLDSPTIGQLASHWQVTIELAQVIVDVRRTALRM